MAAVRHYIGYLVFHSADPRIPLRRRRRIDLPSRSQETAEPVTLSPRRAFLRRSDRTHRFPSPDGVTYQGYRSSHALDVLHRVLRVGFSVRAGPSIARGQGLHGRNVQVGGGFVAIGALDDALVFWLGTTLFVSLCPDEVVQEHNNALKNVVTSTWRDAPQQENAGEITDGNASDEK